MTGGSYLVSRKIRMLIENWDRLARADQEQQIGRSKGSGVPLGGSNEFDTPDFAKQSSDRVPVIPR
jgi:deferrochelatase/peroxidase EfeB